ncbi:unnamed protein product [Rotaria magnacalcarata]|uniref:Carboxylesterase type B domain-containing protein n=2 Tax=Rotaria magnacalcarata TaxID=392030 RepID=A0A816GDI8_9BILA|nr:unnamed protein product [Rotaria magnacalcarata]CAF1672773.1 unnamed protein product [Rotaria magnacalcarata]
MNDVYVRFLFYFSIFLLYNNEIYSSSPVILYPSFKRIANQLSHNSTLPECTLSTCKQTQTQANYTNIKVSDEHLFKLSSYDKVNQRNPPYHGPYLVSSTGIYRGKRIEYQNRYLDQFLGIYYGEIPKSLRKPVKKRFNYLLQNATKFSPSCLQSLSMTRNLSYGSFLMTQDFNEDCLSLNIYRPDLRYGEKRKAIMLFSHGGSNQLGSGSLFDGSILAAEGDIIVITMNFRLNFHGFLSSGDDQLRGNYGLWDQLLAVEWIYENAHLFGGDPNRITLVGHSAGAGNVMLIPASRYSRGMIRRVISQSGTGLAPWSINRTPMKLLDRFAQDLCCNRSHIKDSIDCINTLLEHNVQDIYQLQISLTIADDNPYPVIDNDFINDTIDNILQSDMFKNIDFLTGVTLNEGLYFAEYHVKQFYNELQHQTHPINKASFKKKCPSIPSNSTNTISLDTQLEERQTIKTKYVTDETMNSERQQIENELAANKDLYMYLEYFITLNYIEQYIDANFENGKCFIDEVKKKYELPAEGNSTHRLTLFIDLVSDLMFNFHMVHCLNSLAKVSNRNASSYAYVYSHRPTSKVQSGYRDQVKLLPQVIGHFAELDYVFGVPLANNYSRIHQNVNKNYYNYSADEENFSRHLIRYWSNFIKTGDPNKGSFYIDTSNIQWKPYTTYEHSYLYFHMNSIHLEYNYFDEMYNFWLGCFQIESRGNCQKVKIRQYFISFIILFIFLLTLIMLFILWKYCQKKKAGLLFSRRPPAPLVPHSNSVST